MLKDPRKRLDYETGMGYGRLTVDENAWVGDVDEKFHGLSGVIVESRLPKKKTSHERGYYLLEFENGERAWVSSLSTVELNRRES